MNKDAKAAYDTIIAIRNNSSKNTKVSILAQQKNNTFLKEYLRLMYEPRVNFYMKKVDPKASASTAHYTDFDETLLDELKSSFCTRLVSGNEARSAIAAIYNGFKTDWEKELLALLINRDAKSGFGGSTINKVWADLVTDVPYCRCSLPKDAKLAQWPWSKGVYSQQKCDGMFSNITHKADGTVTIASRSGSPFPIDKFNDVVALVEAKIPRGAQCHGELLMYRNGKVLERQDSNGQFNSILQGGEAKPGCTIVYVAWDMIPESEAKAKNKYRVPYKTRFESLASLLDNEHQDDYPLQVVTTKVVNSLTEAYAHYKEMLELGFEGTIIKHPEMIWEDTTSKFQVKLKLEAECELRVVAFKPGNGKNEALFGSLQCVSECGQLEVSLTGFSDELRAQLFEDKDIVIGAIITAKSNCLLKPSKVGGKYSLFLPRFEEIRLEKKTADTLEKIIAQFDAAIAAA